MQDKPGSIVALVGRLGEIGEDDLKRAEPEQLLDLIAACIELSVMAAGELNRQPEEQRLNLLPEASWPRLPVRSALRVIEGGKGRGAPAMWERLHELHAREEAGTLTEIECQEILGIEHSMCGFIAKSTPLPVRPTLGDMPFLIQGDPFCPLVD